MSVNSHASMAAAFKPWKEFLGTADSTSQEQILGKEFQHPDVDPTDRKTLLSNQFATFVVVRNTSGIALLPYRIARWKAAKRNKEVDGYVRLPTEECAGVISPFLPSTGVASNGIFALQIHGPGWFRTDLAGDVGTSFSEGDLLGAATGATTQATTAGRGRYPDFDTAATGSTVIKYALNTFGRAMSANTTAQTNRLVRVMVNILS